MDEIIHTGQPLCGDCGGKRLLLINIIIEENQYNLALVCCSCGALQYIELPYQNQEVEE